MKGKIIGFISGILVLALAAFIFFKFYFVFGEGVKAGELNFVVYKGYVFKTYEGRAIQAGFGKGKGTNPGMIQSYEFEFSVEREDVARELMLNSGNTVQLHYTEYFGALPWRGFTKYIVDSIVTVQPAAME